MISDNSLSFIEILCRKGPGSGKRTTRHLLDPDAGVGALRSPDFLGGDFQFFFSAEFVLTCSFASFLILAVGDFFFVFASV